MNTHDFAPLFRTAIGFDRMARLIDSAAAAPEASSYPPYNIERTDENAYRIEIAVAGFKSDELSIEVKENLGGDLLGIAVGGRQRLADIPDVPTFAEQGLKDFEASGWFGMLLPASVPRDITAKLGAEVARILKLADVQARINDIGLQGVDTSPEQFAAAMKRDFEVWGRVVRDAQIKID